MDASWRSRAGTESGSEFAFSLTLSPLRELFRDVIVVLKFLLKIKPCPGNGESFPSAVVNLGLSGVVKG